MNSLQRVVPLVGRLSLAAIFLMSAAGKLSNFAGTTGHLASKGLPAPGLLLGLAVAAELVGAASLITGYRARLGALVLIGFMLPATLIFHAFWTVGPSELQESMVHFLKNLSLTGGLLYVVAFGPGPVSVDARAEQSARQPQPA